MAREAMDLCLRVLKESNKSRFDSCSARNSVLIIFHITFRDCRLHIFSDNLFRNSCVLKTKTAATCSRRLPLPHRSFIVYLTSVGYGALAPAKEFLFSFLFAHFFLGFFFSFTVNSQVFPCQRLDKL